MIIACKKYGMVSTKMKTCPWANQSCCSKKFSRNRTSGWPFFHFGTDRESQLKILCIFRPYSKSALLGAKVRVRVWGGGGEGSWVGFIHLGMTRRGRQQAGGTLCQDLGALSTPLWLGLRTWMQDQTYIVCLKLWSGAFCGFLVFLNSFHSVSWPSPIGHSDLWRSI